MKSKEDSWEIEPNTDILEPGKAGKVLDILKNKVLPCFILRCRILMPIGVLESTCLRAYGRNGKRTWYPNAL